MADAKSLSRLARLTKVVWWQPIARAAARIDIPIEIHINSRSNEARNERFDKAKYKQRNVVERAIGWLKEYRRIATRYEKNIENYIAMVHLGIVRMILNWN